MDGAEELGALLTRTAARDREAFAELYQRTSAKLLGIILRISQRRDLAEDLLQEVYVKIWERAGDFDTARASAMTWMSVIARNRAIDEIRRKSAIAIGDLPDRIRDCRGRSRSARRARTERATRRIASLPQRTRTAKTSDGSACLLSRCKPERPVAAFRYARTNNQNLAASEPRATQAVSCLMSDEDDIDALAGEYVLGTLDADERAEITARRLREPLLDNAIRFWETRLALLDTATQGTPPNPATWRSINASIDAAPNGAPGGSFIDLTRRLKHWRAAALLSGAIAAALAIGLVWREAADRSPDGHYVAVLQRDAASPAFIVEVDLRSRMVTARPVAAEPVPGRSYELWLVHASLGAPKSLGVVADQGFTVRPSLANYDRATVENGTYAVTLEPAGGSPNGEPSGAALWTGKLVQATP